MKITPQYQKLAKRCKISFNLFNFLLINKGQSIVCCSLLKVMIDKQGQQTLSQGVSSGERVSWANTCHCDVTVTCVPPQFMRFLYPRTIPSHQYVLLYRKYKFHQRYVSSTWEPISLVIMCSPTQETLSLVVKVTLPGKHKSIMIYVPLPGKETHIASYMCFHVGETHFSRDMCFGGTHLTVKCSICSP